MQSTLTHYTLPTTAGLTSEITLARWLQTGQIPARFVIYCPKKSSWGIELCLPPWSVLVTKDTNRWKLHLLLLKLETWNFLLFRANSLTLFIILNIKSAFTLRNLMKTQLTLIRRSKRLNLLWLLFNLSKHLSPLHSLHLENIGCNWWKWTSVSDVARFAFYLFVVVELVLNPTGPGLAGC